MIRDKAATLDDVGLGVNLEELDRRLVFPWIVDGVP